MRTLRPLMLTPGQVAKDYIAGRRASHVPPLKSYLIAALIFFSLFTVFPSPAPVARIHPGLGRRGGREERARRPHVVQPSAAHRCVRRLVPGGERRAMRQPEAFARAFYANIPRAFFVFLPLFALFLELLYRKQGYLVDHLVFSLYYHAFVFVMFSLLFLAGRLAPFLPGLRGSCDRAGAGRLAAGVPADSAAPRVRRSRLVTASSSSRSGCCTSFSSPARCRS